MSANEQQASPTLGILKDFARLQEELRVLTVQNEATQRQLREFQRQRNDEGTTTDENVTEVVELRAALAQLEGEVETERAGRAASNDELQCAQGALRTARLREGELRGRHEELEMELLAARTEMRQAASNWRDPAGPGGTHGEVDGLEGGGTGSTAVGAVRQESSATVVVTEEPAVVAEEPEYGVVEGAIWRLEQTLQELQVRNDDLQALQSKCYETPPFSA